MELGYRHFTNGGKPIEKDLNIPGTNSEWLSVEDLRKLLMELNMMPFVQDSFEEVAVSK